MPTPPAEPAAASGSGIRGEIETNPPQQEDAPAARLDEFRQLLEKHSKQTGGALSDDAYRAAYELGWYGRLQHDRQSASSPLMFEDIESDMAGKWHESPHKETPWEKARQVAKDAWDRVQEALSGGAPHEEQK
jgi:hypothetical protein